MVKLLYGLVLFFFLCLGIGVLGSLLLSTTSAYDDPDTALIKACYDTHRRFLSFPTEAEKGDLVWSCIRHQSRTTR